MMIVPPQVAAFYPLVMAAAIVTGAVLLVRSRSSVTLAGNEKIAVGIGAFVGGMIGAKLPFLFGDISRLLSGEIWFADGKTILTGLVGAYFGVEIAKWAAGVTKRTGDSLIVPAAVAISIGRVACFVGGCCYGAPTTLPWGCIFPVHDPSGIARHPTQIYEAIFHGIAAAVMMLLKRRDMFRGQLAKLYIISYCVYRFVTEFIRPEPRVWGELTFYQWLTLALVPTFAVLWLLSYRTMYLEIAQREIAQDETATIRRSI